MKRSRLRAALGAWLLSAAWLPPAVAQSAPEATAPAHFGLLRGRDLSPFGFLRLDMRPAHAFSAPPGAWAVEVEVGYQNTWALSPNVEDYLHALPGRRPLDAPLAAAIRALPGEKYLVDLELGLVDVAVHRKLDPHWSAYAIASAAAYGGGFLDGAIEAFHKGTGLGNFSRPALARNAFNVIFDLKDVHFQQLGTGRQGGLLDPTVGLRYSATPRPDPWNLVAEAAVKIPLDGRRDYLSNGHADVGLQATLQRMSGRHAAYASLAAVRTRGDILGRGSRTQTVPTAILGYEYAWSDRASLLAQVNASRSTLGHADTGLDPLLRNKYQVSLGMRRRIGGSVLSFALTENVATFNNTPDIGLQLGWVYGPAVPAIPR